MKTKVKHVKYNLHDVYIGRPSIFGNPFVIGKDGNRDDVIEKYRQWVYSQSDLIQEIKKLKGKTLGCWCEDNQNCHGRIIIEIADSILDEEFN